MSLARMKPTEVVEKEGLDWVNLDPKEEYEARLVYIADLGLQRKEFKGEFKGNFQQLALGFEILGEGTNDEDGNYVPRILWDRPFYTFDKMPKNSYELEIYSAFDTSAEENSFPAWENQLGKPVSIKVKNVKDKSDSSIVYDNIASISNIPTKFQEGIAAAITTPAVGDSNDLNNSVNSKMYGLAKWVFNKRLNQDSVEELEEAETEGAPY